VRGGLLAAAVTLTTGSVLFGLRERDMRASARRLLALVERLSHAVLAASRSLERSLLPTEVNLALLRQLREVDAELAQDGDDSSARLALRAEWLHALASAEEAIGQVTQAAQHVDEVLALRRELASRNPDATQDQASLSIAIVRVGDLLARTGQRTAATARYREALAIDERLAELHPDASLLDNLAWSYKRLAGMEAQGGQTMASIELYLRQFDAMRRAFALDQEGEVRLFGMCSTHHSILSCLSALEAPLAEHWAFATVALAWAARLNARAPHNMAYFETCHVIRHEAAAIAGQRGDAVQARRLLDENLNSARAAVTADPRGRVARSCLAAALTAYGAFSRAHGEALAAKALLDECLTLCRAWQQDTHCLPDLAGWVATACEERALLHVEHGEPTHAAQLLRLAMRTAATDLFRACILARLQALGFADDEERVALQRLLANLDRPEAGDELRRCADRISVHVRLSDHAEVARLQLRTSELAAPLLQRLRALLASK
jgi:tetratricopeptide (TPR) repeat protein